MGTVALKPLPKAPTPDGYVYHDMITFGSGSAPGRPHPPGGGGGGGEGPVDPGYSPPWAQIPVDPGYSPPWAQIPPGGGGGGGGGGGMPGTPVCIVPMPPQDPPVAPPAGLPEGSVQVLVIIPGERYPAVGWMQPYPSSGPVEPPTTPPA